MADPLAALRADWWVYYSVAERAVRMDAQLAESWAET